MDRGNLGRNKQGIKMSMPCSRSVYLNTYSDDRVCRKLHTPAHQRFHFDFLLCRHRRDRHR